MLIVFFDGSWYHIKIARAPFHSIPQQWMKKSHPVAPNLWYMETSIRRDLIRRMRCGSNASVFGKSLVGSSGGSLPGRPDDDRVQAERKTPVHA